MGRFKVYDPKELVNILNDSNYGKCLLCERRLKIVMGNIKRHYEQIHSVYVNANANKTKKSRRRSARHREDDKDYKMPNKTRNRIDSNKKDVMAKNNMDTTKPTEIHTAIIPSTTINSSNNNLPCASVVAISESTEHDQLSRSNSKRKFPCHENPTNYNQHIGITPTSKQNRPKNSFAPTPVCQESKLKEIEKKQTSPTSDIKRIKPNEEDDEIQIPCYSYINNIQIYSMDACQPLEFLKCLVETKSHVNIPLRVIQKADTFQKALQNWKPNFQFNYSSQTIGEHIDRMAKKLRQEIIKMVANRLIYLKLDVVSSAQGNLMFVNIQFINDFEIQVITLSALELSDADLATYLKQKVLTTLERYKIDICRVYSIIKDITNNFGNSPLKLNENGGQNYLLNENMDGSSTFPQSVNYSQHLCHNFPGHAIHFVATDIIKQLNENISQSRDSAKSLRCQMSQLNIKQMPLLDNAISWLSVYDMIESLLEVRETVESNKLFLTEVDWLFVTKFVASFRPIVDTALLLQTNDIFTMGDFYREWLLCEIKLDELAGTNEIALYLLEALRKRKLNLFENTSFLSALYMDPRFCYKGSTYFSDKQKEMAIIQLLQIFHKLKTINADTATNHTDINLNDRYSKLEKVTAASLETNMEDMTSYATVSWSNVDDHWVKESLEVLQFEERLSFMANILDYWNMRKHKSPILAKLAEIALAAPATQATISRALNISSLSLIRRKLIENSDNTENLLLLKLNQDLVNKITLEN